jgi:hypothetical protein
MATSKDEYNSLRQEILNHQNNRLTVLGLALTATAALIAAGIQLKNPYLPLVASFVLSAARMQLVYIHAGIQRISSYIRIILEDRNPELNWERASYYVRSSSIKKGAPVRNISSLRPTDNLLLYTGLGSNVLSLYLACPTSIQQSRTPISIALAVFVLWFGIWIYYGYTQVHEWNNMSAEDREAEKWIEFRKSLSMKIASKKRTAASRYRSNKNNDFMKGK